jgi:hypothetical protein
METTRERRSWSYYVPPSEAPSPTITSRDLAVMLVLYDNLFMSMDQLRDMFGGNPGGNFDQRVRLLFKAGYIARPRATRWWRYRDGGGSHSGILTLTNLGAQALVAFRKISRNKRDWDERNRELTGRSYKIPHQLGIGEVRVAFDRALKKRPLLHLARAPELVHAGYNEALIVPDDARPLYADWTFALVSKRERVNLFFHEHHTGSETLERYGSPEIDHLKDKYERYLSYALARNQIAQFGVKGFRVLTTITGGERMLENVIETAAGVTGDQGVNRFLAIRLENLLDRDPLQVEWYNAAGDPVHLL